MTNLKTILTLATVASLAAALAPTSASAFFARFGGGNHPASIGANHPTGGGHPVNFGGGGHPVNVGGVHLGKGGGFHPRTRDGWHPTVSVNLGYRPGWHRQYGWHDDVRPVEIDVVDRYVRPHYSAPQAVAYAPAPRAKAAVNGQNVAFVEVPNAEFAMVAPGKWVKQGANGEHFEFAEDNRDESSVYLTDASRGVSLQLDLSQKQVYFLGAQPKRAVFPIVNASATVRGG